MYNRMRLVVFLFNRNSHSYNNYKKLRLKIVRRGEISIWGGDNSGKALGSMLFVASESTRLTAGRRSSKWA